MELRIRPLLESKDRYEGILIENRVQGFEAFIISLAHGASGLISLCVIEYAAAKDTLPRDEGANFGRKLQIFWQSAR